MGRFETWWPWAKRHPDDPTDALLRPQNQKGQRIPAALTSQPATHLQHFLQHDHVGVQTLHHESL